MALADIPTSGQSRRLDSWKEIAEYLGRDVRTVARWEAQGLPLHRVPGGKGSSVFALTSEIDAWMSGDHPESVAPPVSSSRGRLILLTIAGAAALTLAVIIFVWRGSVPAREGPALRVIATQTEVSISDPSGGTRVIHRFDPRDGLPIPGAPARVADLNADGEPEILVGVSSYVDQASRENHHGELLNLSVAGAVRWRFAFDDVIRFGDQTMSGPWAISDWQASPAAPTPKVAVAAHDFTWWGSMVAILDQDGRRLSAFVNPGWLESLLWLNPGRLAVAGFSNARDEAVLSIVDANDANGQAPGTAGTAFACADCSPAPPFFYAAFPRSEVNRLTGARFNRAGVSALDDGILVTAVELPDSTASTRSMPRSRCPRGSRWPRWPSTAR